jgi:glycosyltransferase involved in cell wall biosynthesis
LWEGAGVKLKTVTLLGAGIPAAVTPIAVEGLAVEDGIHCLIRNDPHGLATATLQLLTNDSKAESIGAAARRLIAEKYTWPAVAKGLYKVVDSALAGQMPASTSGLSNEVAR